MNQYTHERAARTAYTGKRILRCFVCSEIGVAGAHGVHQKRPFMVCRPCLAKYDDPVGQATRYGRRFRFVLRSEIPHQDLLGINEQNTGIKPNRVYRDVYKILLLIQERCSERRKEVNWMVDESAVKVLKLPGKLADLLLDTVALAGDDFKIADDQALIRIRDMLEEYDPEIFARARSKRKKRKRS